MTTDHQLTVVCTGCLVLAAMDLVLTIVGQFVN